MLETLKSPTVAPGRNNEINKKKKMFDILEDLVDVTLACEDRDQFQAHKIFPKAFNKFFKEIPKNIRHLTSLSPWSPRRKPQPQWSGNNRVHLEEKR